MQRLPQIGTIQDSLAPARRGFLLPSLDYIGGGFGIEGDGLFIERLGRCRALGNRFIDCLLGGLRGSREGSEIIGHPAKLSLLALGQGGNNYGSAGAGGLGHPLNDALDVLAPYISKGGNAWSFGRRRRCLGL